MTFRTRMRGALPYLIAAALGFVSAFLIVAFAVFPSGSAAGDVVIPSVTGLTLSEASSRLARANLRAKEERHVRAVPRRRVPSWNRIRSLERSTRREPSSR